MSERMIPVPVSLIEEAADIIEGDRGVFSTTRRLRALILQPTTTAECSICEGTGKWTEIVRDGFVPRVVLRECPVHGVAPAAPPSIADMAPGTTFTAELLVGSGVWRWRWDGARALCLNDAYALTVKPSTIDPSTIRDVTTPNEGATNAPI